MGNGPLVARVDVQGIKETLRALDGKKTDVAKKISRRLFAKLAQRARDGFKADAPVDKGVLRRAIKVRGTRGGGAQVYVDRRVAPHVHFANKGTKERKTKKGWARGKVTGTEWIKRNQDKAKAAAAELAGELSKAVVADILGSI